MMASDLIIGMHNTVLFTWGGFVLIALLGVWIKKHKTPARAGYASLISSLVFYLVSNFGVWAMGWYPRNFSGLVSCYVMALPFLRNFTIATIFYTALFFGLYEIVARWVKNTKFSSVLLEI
jgi:LPXTG-motif cell wall-anchored protein